MTAYWLTNNFQQKSAVLRVCQLNVSHTAKNICDAIQCSMNEFLIPASKVHLVARDNAANMVAGIREAGYESLPWVKISQKTQKNTNLHPISPKFLKLGTNVYRHMLGKIVIFFHKIPYRL